VYLLDNCITFLLGKLLYLMLILTYHGICNKSNTTGATCGAGTAYSFRSTPPGLVGFVLRNLLFSV